MKKMNWKSLKQNGILLLYIATIIGLGFNFIGSVLNAKLLSKEAFGDWKYIQNYLMLISYVVNFGVYWSGGRLIAATNNTERIKLLKGYMLYASLIGLGIMFLITLVTGLFFGRVLSHHIFLILLPLSPLFIIHPLMFYFEAVFQAERKMVSFAIYKALPPILYVLCLYGLKHIYTVSVWYNAVLFYLTYFAVFLVFLIRDRVGRPRRGHTPELDELWAENKTLGIHIYYGSLWGVGSGYLLAILIGYFNLNNTDVGNYSLALNFIIPLTFLPGIFGTSHFRSFIQADRIPGKVLWPAIGASALLLVGTLLGIDFFIRLFLDNRFAPVGYLVRLGATAAILHGFGDFINKFLTAKGKGKYIRNVAIAVGLVQVLSSLVLIKLFSATGAMIAKSLGSLVYFGSLAVYYYRNYIESNPKLERSHAF